MKIIVLALGLGFLIEFVTVYLRVVLHTRSAPIQKKLHMPRIHHCYAGLAIVLLDHVYLHREVFFVIGYALILSDIIHHLIFEPYIAKRGYDIHMKHHRQIHSYIARVPAAIGLIIVGLFALVTPFTPGSWLALIGIGMLGRKSVRKRLSFLRRKRTGKTLRR